MIEAPPNKKSTSIKDNSFDDISARSRSIFREIVEAYVETGEAVGSRTLAKRLNINLSPASIRNVMADLEELGLLFAPHTSAGRLPTEAGLRFFVDGLLEFGNLTRDERDAIEARCSTSGRTLEDVYAEATSMLAGLSRCAGLVIAPKAEKPLKHVEFVSLDPKRILVVLVNSEGAVENRVIESLNSVSSSDLVGATNYVNARLAGKTLSDLRDELAKDLDSHRSELDELTSRVIATGLAAWSGGEDRTSLIVRGQSQLLDDVTAIADLDRIRVLFDVLETKKGLTRLLELAQNAEGVRIYIGSEDKLFGLTGCSLVVAPYHDSRDHIVGAIGVIGPTRINYGRIIPMVDYTAQVIGRLMG
ncbi:MAG: heat-inducible transcriptional repressor HrcA [Alphaproteobacteria bacterium]|nr:heat-inducible transcriptional repressor HrcA [Alphaproteobacteria bacterium]